MSEDDTPGGSSRIKEVGPALARAAVVVGVGLATSNPLVAALTAGVTDLTMDGLRQRRFRAMKARDESIDRELYIELHALLEAAPDAEARRIIEERCSTPEADENLLSAWRLLFEAHDPAAWLPLRRLGIRYVAEARPTDGFYRDASALLIDCVANDITAIRELLARDAEELAKPPMIGHDPALVEIVMTYHAPGETPHASMNMGGSVAHGRMAVVSTSVDPLRAISLLGAHGFARVSGDQITFEHRKRIRTELLRQLLA